jgi:hypothetical protein
VKTAFRLFCCTTALLATAHQSPAPILEDQGNPAPAAAATTTKPKAAPVKRKSGGSSDSSSIRRFEGRWQASSSQTQASTSWKRVGTLVINNGSAQWSLEQTSTLAPGKTWSDIPAPYNAISPVYKKWTSRSTDLKPEGSNLRISWPGSTLVDWSPKKIPATTWKNTSQPGSAIYLLSGDQLIQTNGKTTATWTRVK